MQLKYNEEHGITPETVRKAIRKGIEEEIQARKIEREAAGADEVRYISQEYLNELEAEMLAAAENLEFERAANLRDKILDLKKKMGESIPVGDADTPGFAPNGKRGRRGGGRRGKGKGRGLPRPGSPSQTWRRLNDGGRCRQFTSMYSTSSNLPISMLAPPTTTKRPSTTGSIRWKNRAR